MSRVLLDGALIGVLMLGCACGTGLPGAPDRVPAAPAPAQRPQLPLGELIATYAFSGPLDYPIRGVTAGSRYLLYDNGVFGLQYDAFPHVYVGRFRREGTTISFRFDDASTWEQGDATGTLKGALLEVRYSEPMEHADFENAVYRRSE